MTEYIANFTNRITIQCVECGAMVGDKGKHTAWHATLTNIATSAERGRFAASMLTPKGGTVVNTPTTPIYPREIPND